MKLSKALLIPAAGFLLSSCFTVTPAKKSNSKKAASIAVAKADTTKKNQTDSIKKAVLKPYKEVITSKAITDSGLIIVHKIDTRYFFEVPDALLEKDLLVVNRIIKAAATYERPAKAFLGYSGDQIGASLIRFSKGPGNKLFIKTVSFADRSSDSSVNGMYRAVQNSNLQPITTAFDVKTYSADSAAVVVDVTDYLALDNNLFSFDPTVKKVFGLGGFLKDKSFIEGMQSFPINTELQMINTYQQGDETSTYEINSSIVLLPKEPMKPRIYDERVGYFTNSYRDFDSPKGVELTNMITRWRLEPRDEDKEKYLRGELVEPKKPIVYYIDPATPRKWVPYLIQGVNDWQQAFEKAGFKNAIYALEAPTNDSSFSLFDARHNAIIYKPSVVANASGPSIADPRTGEILETHVNWYHNIQEILHDWYFVQAGPNDKRAQKMVFDDTLMGELVRYVCAHEVGHTLGLMHNFGASSTVPVDSLRSKTYVDKYGYCPSIMDYSRFNYVAQPEDGFTEKELLPKIGMYDEWAIEWGYRWLPQLKTREAEKAYMNNWITNQLKKDKRYWYGEQPLFFIIDPRKQSEDIGDNAMKAGYWGIQNLKRVTQHLTDWAIEPNEDYSSLSRMQQMVMFQYYTYCMHVMANIGLFTWNQTKQGDGRATFGFTPIEKQKEAVQFLQQELFDTPEWLYNKDVFLLAPGYGANGAANVQQLVITSLLNYDVYQRMEFVQNQYPGKAYTFDELLTDLEAGIWKELSSGKAIDFNRRKLQKNYIEQLIRMNDVQPSDDPLKENASFLKLRSDYLTTVRAHLSSIQQKIAQLQVRFHDKESLRHIQFVKERIKYALQPNGIEPLSAPKSQKAFVGEGVSGNEVRELFFENKDSSKKQTPYLNCWEVKNWFDQK